MLAFRKRESLAAAQAAYTVTVALHNPQLHSRTYDSLSLGGERLVDFPSDGLSLAIQKQDEGCSTIP